MRMICQKKSKTSLIFLEPNYFDGIIKLKSAELFTGTLPHFELSYAVSSNRRMKSTILLLSVVCLGNLNQINILRTHTITAL